MTSANERRSAVVRRRSASSAIGTANAPAISSSLPADATDHLNSRPTARSVARDDERPSRRLGERVDARPEARPTAPMRAGDAALGERHRETALGDVVGAAERAGADARRGRLVRRTDAAASIGGSPPRSASPRSLASSEPASDGRERPGERDQRRPRARSRAGRRDAASGSRPTMPITGVGKIGPVGASL